MKRVSRGYLEGVLSDDKPLPEYKRQKQGLGAQFPRPFSCLETLGIGRVA